MYIKRIPIAETFFVESHLQEGRVKRCDRLKRSECGYVS